MPARKQPPERFPLADALVLIDLNQNEIEDGLPHPGRVRLAEMFGVSDSTIDRWHQIGVDFWHAETVALRLPGRYMPWEVWPEWWDVANRWVEEYDEKLSRGRKRKTANNLRYKQRKRAEKKLAAQSQT